MGGYRRPKGIRERGRERERDRQTDRQTDRQKYRETKRQIENKEKKETVENEYIILK